jgi:hypothetical protein
MISRLSSLLLVALSVVPAAFSQSALRITAQTSTGFLTVSDGSSIPVQSTGRETNVVFTIANGAGSAMTINQITINGSGFGITAMPPLPVTIPAGGSVFFNVRYSPVFGQSSSAQATVQYTEANVARQTSFTLTGSAPDYAFTVTSPDGARTAVQAGGRISFGAVRPGTPATYTLSVSNRGSGTGTLNAAVTSGRDFSTTASGSQPIPAGQEVLVPVTFSPQTRGTASGTLTLDLGVGTATFTLDGTGATPDFVLAYALRSDGNVRPVVDGGRVTFAATPATTSAVAEIIIGNQGNGPGSIRSVVLEGSAFQINGLPLVPATLEPGAAVRFNVQFTPPRLGSFTATLRIETDQRTVTATLEGTTSEPALSLFYVDPQSRNTLPILTDGTLALPSTAVDATTVLPILVQNTGTGTGFVNSVSVQGDGFSIAELPSLPATVLAAKEFRFGLQFSPKQRQLHSGVLKIETASGTLTVRLTGQGTSALLSMEITGPDGDMQPVASGAELAFSAAVGQTLSRTVRFTNTGNSAAQITAISITGAGFQLGNVPFLPLTLAVGDSQVFTIAFAPGQPGISRGRLRIGDQFCDVAGTGLASRLEFSYTNDAGTTNLTENGTVVLTPARVGESSRIDFALQNSGTSAVVISTVDITPPNAQFALDGVPPLPLNLEPGASMKFAVRFAPNNIGSQTAVLRINNTGFTLSGSARQPLPLPAHHVEGPSGTQEPLQQPAVRLTLAAPYSLPLRGTLTLSFLSDVFSENPAVQFSTGGRIAQFTIPAGATQAVFDNGATEIRLQTGTMAGTIQVRPAFATQAGLDLTPTDAEALTINIGRSAPRLLSAEISGRSPNQILLLVTGYTTTRTLRQMVLTLRPRSGEKLTASDITINLDPVALVWFQSTASQGFGGLFSLQIPLAFQRGDSTEDLVSKIQSVGVTVSNEISSSNGLTVTP